MNQTKTDVQPIQPKMWEKFTQIIPFVSVGLLMMLAVLPWDFPFQIPGREVFANAVVLDNSQIYTFRSQLKLNLFVDFVFLTTWLLSWLGFLHCLLQMPIFSRNPQKALFYFFMAGCGVAGVFLDVSENLFQLSMLEAIQRRVPVDPATYGAWNTVVLLSYLLPMIAMHFYFIATALAGQYDLYLGKRRPALEFSLGIGITSATLVLAFILEISEAGFLWFVLLFLYLGLVMTKRCKSPPTHLEPS